MSARKGGMARDLDQRHQSRRQPGWTRPIVLRLVVHCEEFADTNRGHGQGVGHWVRAGCKAENPAEIGNDPIGFPQGLRIPAGTVVHDLDELVQLSPEVSVVTIQRQTVPSASLRREQLGQNDYRIVVGVPLASWAEQLLEVICCDGGGGGKSPSTCLRRWRPTLSYEGCPVPLFGGRD